MHNQLGQCSKCFGEKCQPPFVCSDCQSTEVVKMPGAITLPYIVDRNPGLREYKVVQGLNFDEISARINEAINDGFILYGDLMIIEGENKFNDSGFVYFQSMLKYA